MYALNRNISEVRRLIDGNTPHYDEDLPRMNIYATPAASVQGIHGKFDKKPFIGSHQISFPSTRQRAKITWNSTGSSLLWTMPQEKINIPKTGYYEKFTPLITYYFYSLGTPIPGVFRIGKKNSPARLQTISLSIDEKHGTFRPTCPVNVVDLPDETEILEGSLITVPPAPLLLNSELKGEYVEGIDSYGTAHRIPTPNKERFADSWK
jgi:CRISPR type I-D-associated protein Csc1